MSGVVGLIPPLVTVCVSGVTVVTQNPPDLTPTKGETTTMHCNQGTVTDYATHWYKQAPGGVPQHVLRFRQSWSSVHYGSGFSSPRFTSTCSSLSDCNLIISNVEVGDSAVYYCKTWDTSAQRHVSRLIEIHTKSLPLLVPQFTSAFRQQWKHNNRLQNFTSAHNLNTQQIYSFKTDEHNFNTKSKSALQ
uniref:Ig-like domain-containing protein n=1 Tax=Astyanax mexicanus TaxID=7994 RepID=A0A3B1IPA3_ASTMX